MRHDLPDHAETCPDCHLPPLKGCGSGRHVSGSPMTCHGSSSSEAADDPGEQWLEARRRTLAVRRSLEATPDAQHDDAHESATREQGPTGTDHAERPKFGDPAEIVTAFDRDEQHREFVRLLDRLTPDWHADAECSDFDTDLWFPAKGQSSRPAYDICGRCPVRDECLAEALADVSLDHGIRGGLSVAARKQRRKTIHRLENEETL